MCIGLWTPWTLPTSSIMNPIVHINDSLADVLDGCLDQGYTPEQVVDVLAGAPTFSLGALPQTREEVDDRISAAESILQEVVKPALADESEFEEVAGEMIHLLRAELTNNIDTHMIGGSDEWNEWADEPKYLLKDYPETFQYDAAILVSITAQFGDYSLASDEVILGLLDNLRTSSHLIQTACARALADIASEHPCKTSAYLKELIGASLYVSTKVRRELLMAIVHVSESGDECLETDNKLLSELSKYCLGETTDSSVQNFSLRILRQVAEHDPAACVPALESVIGRQNASNPGVADKAKEVLDIVANADIDVRQIDAGPSYTLEMCCRYLPTREQSIQCPTITDDCSDWGLMADGESLDSARIYRQIESKETQTKIRCLSD